MDICVISKYSIKSPSLKIQFSVELGALERQQAEPLTVYEARKITLVKYADAIRNLAKENSLSDIAPI